MSTPRRLITTLAAATAMAAAAAPAHAQTTDTSVTITGGSLEYSTPLTAGNFPNVKLNGLAQVVNANVNPYVVTDSRGGSAGWNLTVRATQFADGAGNKLPAGSMRMALPPVPTTNTVENPLALPPVVNATALSPIDGASAQQLASAAAVPLSGAGAWTFTPTTGLTLTVPAAVAPGTYTSQITTTLATGP